MLSAVIMAINKPVCGRHGDDEGQQCQVGQEKGDGHAAAHGESGVFSGFRSKACQQNKKSDIVLLVMN